MQPKTSLNVKYFIRIATDVLFFHEMSTNIL